MNMQYMRVSGAGEVGENVCRKKANYLLAVLHNFLPFSAEEEQDDDV